MKKMILSLGVISCCISNQANAAAGAAQLTGNNCNSASVMLCLDVVSARPNPEFQLLTVNYTASGGLTLTFSEAALKPYVKTAFQGSSFIVPKDIQLQDALCATLGAPKGTKIRAGKYDRTNKGGSITINIGSGFAIKEQGTK